MRVDKKYFFEKLSLEFYLDIQNLYNFQATLAPILNVERDENGLPLEDPDDASRYDTYLMEDNNGRVLPSIGLVLTF